MSIQMKKLKRTKNRVVQASFTLVETVIALAIMAFLIIEVATVQGNAIVFSEYGHNITQATWLARRVLSQVEYNWYARSFSDLDTKVEGKEFDDFEGYFYDLEIKEWKFPFIKLLTGALGGGGEEGEEKEDDKEGGGFGQILDTVVKQVFGDEPKFMTASTKVCWPEGAQRSCTSLTLLLTNQAKVDEALLQLKPVYDKIVNPPKPAKDKGKGKGKGKPPARGAGKPAAAGKG
jgi:type II secretory pathway pseudopilin PulG